MNFLYALINNVLVITPIIVLMLLLTPLLDKKYAAIGRYWLWMLIMVALCIPFASFIKQPSVQIDVPVAEVWNIQTSTVDATQQPLPEQTTVVYESNESNIPSNPSQSDAVAFKFPNISFSSMLLIVWMVGIITSLFVYITSHLSLVRFTRRWRMPVNEIEIISELDKQRFIMGVDKDIELWYCKAIKAPMLIGFKKPMLFLPDSFQGTDDVSIVFRHELTHYKRHDLWYKLGLMIVKSIFWFNPVIHMMATQANKDIETVCDTLTVRGMDMEQRKRYSEIILSMAGGVFYRSQLATHFGGGKNMLKQRFSNILGNNKKNGTAIFIALGVLIFATGMMIGFEFAPVSTFALEATEQELIYEVNTDQITTQVQTQLEYEAENLGELLGQMFSEKWGNGFPAGMVPESSKNITDFVMELYDNSKYNQYNNNNWGISNDSKYETSLETLKNLVFDEAKLVESTFGEFNDVSSLNISTSFDNITIKQGGDKLVMKYYQWLEDSYALIFVDGELTLSANEIPYLKKGNGFTTNWLGDYLNEQGKQIVHTVEITIPKNMSMDNITLSTASGSINIGDFTTSNLYIDTASGSANIEAFKGKVLDIDTASGGVNIKNCVLDNLIIDTASGDTIVNASKIASIDIDTTSGDATVNDSNTETLSIDTTSGKANVKDCVYSSMKISTTSGNGYIKLTDKADNYDIDFDTISGKLTYNDKAASSMGMKNAAKKISLDSISGSFSIDDIK